MEGHDEATIARIRSPSAIPTSSEAARHHRLSVAAELLRVFAADHAGAAMTHLSGSGPRHPRRPVPGGPLRNDEDAGLLCRRRDDRRARRLRDRPAPPTRTPFVDLRGGVLLPGLVDTHVHFPQVRVIGALGMPLLEWLERCALPEECHLEDPAYAQEVAAEFIFGLASAGTTTSLVFGSHFAPAVDLLFSEAERIGLRVTSGWW